VNDTGEEIDTGWEGERDEERDNKRGGGGKGKWKNGRTCRKK